MVLVVKELCGENALTPQDGERLFALILPELVAGKDVTADFAGVRIVSSQFLNHAIGRLYGDVSDETIDRHLSITNMSDIGQFSLRRVVLNAKEYFRNPNARTILDASADADLDEA